MHMIDINSLLLIGSLLILLSIGIAKLSDNLGVPVLLLFLGVGMLAGPEGPWGIRAVDAGTARSVGIMALVFILFAGGLDTKWKFVRPVVWQSLSLATLGVLLTALVVGVFSQLFLGFTLVEGLLLGAVISSTDAAAVFALLRSKNVSLRGTLTPLLELESGSNDPMAVFLTTGLIQIYTVSESSAWDILLLFIYQMGFGAVIGLGLGKTMVYLLNHLRFTYQGFYPVFSIAFAAFVYAATSAINGSGFLAVYVAGVVVGNSEIVQRRSLFRFFDGLAWLSQIGMFLTLGLLVFPSHVAEVLGGGLLVSAFLMFVARPLSVFLSLALAKLHWREKVLVSWVGIRGAVPIILATFPLLANLPKAELLFNIVFFIVMTSALFQGWSIPQVARLLKVDGPLQLHPSYPLEFEGPRGTETELIDLVVPYSAAVIGRSLVELGFPEDSLIVLIIRNEDFIVPSGGSVLRAGDTLLALTTKRSLPTVREILSEQR